MFNEEIDDSILRENQIINRDDLKNLKIKIVILINNILTRMLKKILPILLITLL